MFFSDKSNMKNCMGERNKERIEAFEEWNRNFGSTIFIIILLTLL